MNSTALNFALFSPCDYRLSLFQLVLERIRNQEPGVFILLSILNWPRGSRAPGWLTSKIDQIRWVQGCPFAFQKEALFNAGALCVPKRFNKLIFLDADVLFDADDWLYEISKALETHDAIQCFQQVCYVPRDVTLKWISDSHLASPKSGLLEMQKVGIRGVDLHLHTGEDVVLQSEGLVRSLTRGDSTGNPGMCWAVRREFFERVGGFPWQEIFTGANDLFWVLRIMGAPRDRLTPPLQYLWDQIESETPEVKGARVEFYPETIFHLWHQPLNQRSYHHLQSFLPLLEFQPKRDLVINSDGAVDLSCRGRRLDEALRLAHRSNRVGESTIECVNVTR